MNKLIIGITIVLCSSSFISPLIDENIARALKTGNTVAISNFFNATVDLTLPKNEGIFSKAQAELILKTFFETNKPSDFKVIHDGESKNKSLYSIGNLTTSTGVFRTYILYQEKGDTIVILELRIELEE